MDRNLGASRKALSSSDDLAFGDLYQWGRGRDGHQCRDSRTRSGSISIDRPGHDRFILETITTDDWRNPQNNSLWQGLGGINNPCPSGFRIPTGAEWAAEIATWSSQNSAGAYASPLKLPLAGQRNDGAGFFFAGQIGFYWSSTTGSPTAQGVYIDASTIYNDADYDSRGNGYSIRCIRN